jgi:hypothetical protein
MSNSGPNGAAQTELKAGQGQRTKRHLSGVINAANQDESRREGCVSIPGLWHCQRLVKRIATFFETNSALEIGLKDGAA